MKHMEELKEMLCEELDKIANKGTMSAGDLDMVDKLSHSIKSLSTIEAMDGYSQEDGYSMRGNSYARRDGRGRYSREGSYEGSYRGGSNRGSSNRGSYNSYRGYSRDGEDMVEQLEDMLEDAPDMKTKKAIKQAIKHIEE